MSLQDLTRNSFQGGISAQKWLALCKLLIAQTPEQNKDQTATNLSNSVLWLFRSYPGDPILQEYLKLAIQDGLIPLPIYITTLLHAARSVELHVPATLDGIIRIALDAHYSSGGTTSSTTPIGSVVSEDASPTTVLETIRYALALLRTAHTLPPSHFHQLITSSGELVILLGACVTDLNKVPTTQAIHLFTEMNELIGTFRLEESVVSLLGSFLVSLQLLIGDDVKAAKEAQFMTTTQFVQGKTEIWGPSSETDVISLALLLDYLVTYMAHDWGAGDTSKAVALLLAAFRWSSWSPSIYFTQLLVSAFTCLSQAVDSESTRLWKAFVVGRLPFLVVALADVVAADNSINVDMRAGFQDALSTVLRRNGDLIHALSRDAAGDGAEDDSSRPFSREFLHQVLKAHLISQEVAIQIDPLLSNDGPPKWLAETHDTGVDLSLFLESKLLHDHGADDTKLWVERISREPSYHSVFASIVFKWFSSTTSAADADSLGQICKILHTYDHALEIVALHVRVYDLIFYALQFLEDYDCETVADPQTAVTHLGNVVLFVQYVIVKFKFETHEFTKNGRTVSSSGFTDLELSLRMRRTAEDLVMWNTWFKALFDSSSEGIEDNILRATNPKALLRVAIVIISQAMSTAAQHKLEKDVLMNGVSYFTGPLLNWTLVGVIKVLYKDIHNRLFAGPSPILYEITQTLISSPSCPRSVLALCSPQIISLVSVNKKRAHALPQSFANKVPVIRKMVADAIGLKGGPDALGGVTQHLGTQIWYQQVQKTVQNAFSMARSRKAPNLDIHRCLTMLSPIQFLELFWVEAVSAANTGELEACRRIATFVLASPPQEDVLNTIVEGTNSNHLQPRHPPLLPIFLHIVLPSIIGMTDHDNQLAADQRTTRMELLVAIISSVLNAALHLEWALRSVQTKSGIVRGVAVPGSAASPASVVGGTPAATIGASSSSVDRLISMLGQSSTSMARRLALDLRKNRTSDVSKFILRKLSSSHSFVANFPVFKSERGT